MDFDFIQCGFQIDFYLVFVWFWVEVFVFWLDCCKGWFVFGYDDVWYVCDDKDDFSVIDLVSVGFGGMFKFDDLVYGEVCKVVEEVWFGMVVWIFVMVECLIMVVLDVFGSCQEFDFVDEFV